MPQSHSFLSLLSMLAVEWAKKEELELFINQKLVALFYCQTNKAQTGGVYSHTINTHDAHTDRMDELTSRNPKQTIKGEGV
ncbi:hypothetical protein BKA57DRAFT_220023 [Linnemannia elongata]|nr:hypothetical protein BKA57DRAFT_220023 [Linnemannia elongata]